MARLTEDDLKDIQRAQNVINHVIDGDTKRLGFVEVLEILQWALTAIAAIMFTEKGKPKSGWQLVLSLPGIIRFIKELTQRITNAGNRKPKITNEAKVVDAIKKAQEDAGK